MYAFSAQFYLIVMIILCRSDVWKYLLGYYKWHQPSEVRETNRKARVEEYFRMKLQWKSMSEDQQNRFASFRERKTQIEKDIGRTDRSHPFYLGDNNPNVALLQVRIIDFFRDCVFR